MLRLKNLLYFLPFLLLACSQQTKEHTAIIPKGTAWVAAYDVKAISEKSKLTESGEYKTLQMAEGMVKKQPKEIQELYKSFMKDPLSLGIDLSENVFSFFYPKKGEERRVGNIGVAASMGDRGKFRENLKKLSKGMPGPLELEVKEEKGRAYLYMEGTILIWDDSRLLFLGSGDQKIKEDKIKKEAVGLLEQKKDKSLVHSNEDFQKFMERRKDVSNWVAFENMPEDVQEEWEEIPYQDKELFKGMSLHTYLAFKSNSVELTHYTNNADSKTFDRFKKALKEGVDQKLMTYLPEKTYMGMGAALDPDQVYKVIQENADQEWEETKEKVKEELRVDPDKIASSLSGDMLMTINGFGTYKRTYTDFVRKGGKGGSMGGLERVEKTTDQLYPKGSFLIKTRTPYIKKQLEEKISKFDTLLTSVGDYYRVDSMEIPFYFGWKDDKLMCGTHEEPLKKLYQGGYSSSSLADSEMGSMFASSPSSGSMLLDLDKYPKLVHDYLEESMGPRGKKSMENSMDILKRIDMQSKDKTGVKITLHLTEGKGNSLNRLLKKADENAGKFMGGI